MPKFVTLDYDLVEFLMEALDHALGDVPSHAGDGSLAIPYGRIAAALRAELADEQGDLQEWPLRPHEIMVLQWVIDHYAAAQQALMDRIDTAPDPEAAARAAEFDTIADAAAFHAIIREEAAALRALLTQA